MYRLAYLLISALLGSCLGAEYDNITDVPRNFKIGVASSAYQIEGGWNASGKGPNFFDWVFHLNSSLTVDGRNGDVACDSYNKWQEDVEIIKNLGADFYRFSISWSRILPKGTSDYINEDGINYYKNILKALKKNGIEPWVSIFHWDLPLSIHLDGGWLNPKIVDYFGNYSRVVFEQFGDYVTQWFTINEPKQICLSSIGMGTDDFINGIQMYTCMRHTILAHARAYHIYDDEFRKYQNGNISVVLNCDYFFPLDPNNASDVEATERALAFGLEWFPDVVYKGDWPARMKKRVAERSALEGYNQSRLPEWSQEEIEYVNHTIDFYSINYYTSFYVQDEGEADTSLPASFVNDERIVESQNSSWTCLETRCIYPPGLQAHVRRVDELYNPPHTVIAENGWIDLGGLNDTTRIEYIRDHMRALIYLLNDVNIQVTGYAVWTFMDNFEWLLGYVAKFGMVQVDFESDNRTRTIKDSGKWFSNMTATRQIN